MGAPRFRIARRIEGSARGPNPCVLGREGLLSHSAACLEFDCRHLTSGQCSDLPQVRPPRIWGCFFEYGVVPPSLVPGDLRPSFPIRRKGDGVDAASLSIPTVYETREGFVSGWNYPSLHIILPPSRVARATLHPARRAKHRRVRGLNLPVEPRSRRALAPGGATRGHGGGWSTEKSGSFFPVPARRMRRPTNT